MEIPFGWVAGVILIIIVMAWFIKELYGDKMKLTSALEKQGKNATEVLHDYNEKSESVDKLKELRDEGWAV